MKTKIIVDIKTEKIGGKEELKIGISRKGGVPVKYGSFIGALHIGICGLVKKLTTFKGEEDGKASK